MNRRVLFAMPLAVLVACSGMDTTTPSVEQPTLQPAISDGAHSPGNPDFFFLPPMVLPTSSLSNWTNNGFNRSLSPSVEICRLKAETAAAVATVLGSQCRAGAPVILSGTAIKKHFPGAADPSDVLTGLPGDWAHYHAKWPFPNNCNTTFFYRVRAKVGSVQLGFADVQCVTKLIDLLRVDYRKFGAAFRGTTLQIPFRIEKFALCEVPGVGPCGSATITTATGGSATFTPPGGTEPSGVTIPAQPPTAGLAPVINITIEPCDPLNPRATDLPVFGPCMRITSVPALPPAGLAAAATVFICDLQINVADTDVLNHAQLERITLHRLDEVGAVQTMTALPHAPGCTVDETGGGLGNWSVKGILRDLVHGRVKSAGGQVLAMLVPEPLYARRRLNLGAGGKTKGFSDFENALPVKMVKVAGGDGQTGAPGSPLPVDPSVLVTDLADQPVRGVTVTFAPTDGSAIPLVVVTGADGLAITEWTLSSTPGANTLVASGRGIAGADNNGPRCGVDPFAPIQGVPHPAEFGPTSPCVTGSNGPADAEEPVLTGSQTFTANGGGIRIAGVGANSGNQAADAVFSSGDLQGTISRISEATFNGMSPAQLRAAYEVLIITWASDPSLNVDWATRLEPYLQLGGGVIYEDPNNVGDLAPLVGQTSVETGSSGTFSVIGAVPGLTDGIDGNFVNNHIEFEGWNSALLAPFLDLTDTGADFSATVGLYGKIGAGCIVLTGPDQDFHGLRGGSDAADINQYNLLLNEIRFVAGGGTCEIPPPSSESPQASSSIKASDLIVGSRPSRSNRPAVRNPQVPQQKKVTRRPIQ